MFRPTVIASLIIAATTAATTAAHAGPTVVLDPTELTFSLAAERVDTDKSIVGSYRVRVHGLVVANAGQISRNDRLEVEWSAGGKKLDTVECTWAGSGDQAPFNCESETRLDAYGDVTATVRYTVDAEDATFVMSTHQLKVGRFWNWYERSGKRLYYARYQVVPLDLLTSGIVWHDDHGAGERRVIVYGWQSANGGVVPEATSLRCTVDGKRLPDFDASTGDSLSVETSDWRDPAVNERIPQVRLYSVWVQRLQWGIRADLEPGYATGDFRVMGDNPGAWSCDLRAKGKAVRTFQFTVGANGLVARHPEQDAGLALPGTERMIDVLVPDTAPDPYVDPAQTRSGGFWGQAWHTPATGERLVPKLVRPGFEAAPPKGASAGAAAKPAKAKAKAKRRGK